MSRRRAGVGVVKIAIGEVRAVVEEEAEAAITELIAIALQIVAAKLIDHDHDNQLGMAIVRGSGSSRNRGCRDDSDKNTAMRGEDTLRWIGERVCIAMVVYTAAQRYTKASRSISARWFQRLN